MATIFGGNRGYKGYSESVRSFEAKQKGIFPKTLFKKEYGITEKQFNYLLSRGIIYNSEWHHTSKFGNRTQFYSIENKALFHFVLGEKDIAFAYYKKTRNYEKPIKGISHKQQNDKWLKTRHFLNGASEHFLHTANIGDEVIFKGAKLICISKTKHRKAPVFQFLSRMNEFGLSIIKQKNKETK